MGPRVLVPHECSNRPNRCPLGEDRVVQFTEASLNSQLSLLVELQKLDLKNHSLQDQQRKLPERIKAAQSPLDEATKCLKEVTAAVAAIAAERRSSEQDLSIQEAHIQKLRARLTELKTNREYQAHLFEIELATKKNDTLEEKVLLILERGEQKQKELEEIQVQVAEAEKAFTQEKARLESLTSTLAAELTQLEQQQKTILALLDKSVYGRYATLKSNFKVLVVVPIREGACQGCQLQLPPQLFTQVKRADELLGCPYCHRILYWEQAVGDYNNLPTESGEKVEE